MKAEELRIGNWVLEDGKPTRVYSLYEYDERGVNGVGEMYEAGVYTYPDCQPIPLTEDWLVNFGFTSDKGLSFYKDDFWFILSIGNLSRMRGDIEKEHQKGRRFKYKRHDYIKDNILFVHQLQNIYFALTGTELTYTP